MRCDLYLLLALLFATLSSILALAKMTSTIKRVLVTGANKGIGKAICKKILLDYSDTHVILGSREITRGQEAVNDILTELGNEDTTFKTRIEVVSIDVSNDESVTAAAHSIKEKYGLNCLYGLINNAGVGFGTNTLKDVLETNVFGPRRVCQSFLPLLTNSGDGSVVNVSSAAGPMYIAKLPPSEQSFFTSPHTTWEQLEQKISQELSCAITATPPPDMVYGFSKACLNVYTIQLAQQCHPHLRVNSCTPGYILTDLTRPFGNNGPTNTPDQGTVSPLFCLFDKSAGTGAYYGSDAVRSPLDKYRGPGEPAYVPE